ncbi:Interferon regulatory factor 7 [Oryzias melastigma]|uniref:Interferon regulatory factor 7 n=1 Tax=Oryzias melastigma TaxID=30732 RepID=A0A834CJF3_ORYME|nr:Interferon regulatory factor 7 [Oryzias melastigma]
MQSPHKPPFATWLLTQVQTGQYAGLQFVGRNRFRVPWKHNSRRDCNDEDIQIFRAWAVASGKINQFPDNKARWKTNFRCALNILSKHFRMVEDNSKIQHDPHRIYEVINLESECLPAQTSPQESDHSLNIYSSPVEFSSSGHVEDLLNNLGALDLEAQPAEDGLWQETSLQPDPPVQTSYPDQQPSYINPPSFLTQPQPPSLCDLEISIHYRKTEMLKTTMNVSRLQLHYHHEVPEFNAFPLCFPVPDGLVDHKQIDFTNRILNSIQRGLLLEVQDTGIYAIRQDRCHVFVSTDPSSVAPPPPQKLPQSTAVQLLSFAKYIDELKEFKENRGRSPAYTINMCFGEKFPDGKPLEKKLIVVKVSSFCAPLCLTVKDSNPSLCFCTPPPQVVPLICRHFHEMAQMEGASSLNSVSLQISQTSLYDLINAVFGPPAAEESSSPPEPFGQI